MCLLLNWTNVHELTLWHIHRWAFCINRGHPLTLGQHLVPFCGAWLDGNFLNPNCEFNQQTWSVLLLDDKFSVKCIEALIYGVLFGCAGLSMKSYNQVRQTRSNFNGTAWYGVDTIDIWCWSRDRFHTHRLIMGLSTIQKSHFCGYLELWQFSSFPC